jgi:hypothetical protein
MYDKMLKDDLVTTDDVAAAMAGRFDSTLDDQTRRLHAQYSERLLERLRSKDPKLRQSFFADGSGVVLYQNELKIYKDILPGDSDAGKADEILFRCDRLAVDANEFLVGTQLTNSVNMTFDIASVCCHLIASAKDGSGDAVDKTRLQETLKFLDGQLRGVAKYYNQSATRRAQVRYAWGMLRGAVLIYLLALATWGIVSAFTSADEAERLPLMLGVVATGCTGAVVSVMQRMTRSTLDIDYTMGSTVRTLGMFRPVIGAIFALVVFFMLQADLVPHLVVPSGGDESFFFLTIAFVTGFSERLAQDMLTSTEKTVAGTKAEPDAEAPVEAPAGTTTP